MKRAVYIILIISLLGAFGCSKMIAQVDSVLNSEESRTEQLRYWTREDSGRRRLLVFVHGFNSSRETSWELFPRLVNDDPEFKEYNILLYGYDSSLCRQTTDVEHAGEGLGSYLQSIAPKYEAILFVGHSMGGLVALHSILTLQRQERDILTQIPITVLTFGTPHDGIVNANIPTLLCDNKQIVDMEIQNNALYRLKREWAHRFGTEIGLPGRKGRLLTVHALYGAQDQFVPRASACSGFEGSCLQVDGNHITMVKPRSRDHSAYLKLKGSKEELQATIATAIPDLRIGAVDWVRNSVRATGTSLVSADAKNPQTIAMAAQESRQRAIMHLFEELGRVYVTSNSTVDRYIEQDDRFKRKVMGMVASAIVAKQVSHPDGTIETTVEIKLDNEFRRPIVKELQSEGRESRLKKISTSTATEPDNFTGLVVDARGISARPSLGPRLLNADGDDAYSVAYVESRQIAEGGIVAYVPDIESAIAHPRVTPSPMIIKAIRAEGSNLTDIVVSDEALQKLHGDPKHFSFLKKGKVVFIIDKSGAK